MSPMRGSESWDCSAWRKEGTGGSYVSLYVNAYKNLNEGYKEDEARHMTVVPSGRTKGSGQKVKHRKVLLNISKHFILSRVIEHRLSREAAESHFLETYLDRALGNQMQVSLLQQER